MADLGGLIGSFIGGAGAGVADVALREIQAKIDTDKQLTLEAARHANNMALDQQREAGAERRLATTEAGADRRLGVSEAGATERHGAGLLNAKELQQNAQTFTKTENELNRTFQLQMEEKREGAANQRHRESMGVQMAQLKAAQEQVTLVPNADGSMQKMSKDGRNLGTWTDISGNVVYGPKDVAKSTQLMMETNNKVISGLEAEMRTAMDPQEKAAIRSRMEYYVNANRQLSGTSQPETGASGDQQIRYDKDGKAWTKDASGKVVPYTKDAAPKQQGKSSEPPGEQSAVDRYKAALAELQSLKGGLLMPTPKNNAAAIKAKEEEVKRLLQETYK